MKDFEPMIQRTPAGSRHPVLALCSSLVLTLATTSQAADDSARFPTWSWDSVPVYLHFGSNTQLTDDQTRRPLLLNKGWGRDQGEPLDEAAIEMMKQVRAEMGPERLLIFNGFRARQGMADDETKGGMEFLPYADGVKIEHFDQFASATKEDIVMLWRMAAEAAAAGKIVLTKAWPDHEANFTNKAFMKKSPAEREAFAREKLTFPLACFLIGARRHAYFCYGWGYDVEDGQLVEYPEYRRRLGPPQGDASRAGHSWVFTRDFEHASVRVDLEKRTATIEWKSGDVPLAPSLEPPRVSPRQSSQRP